MTNTSDHTHNRAGGGKGSTTELRRYVQVTGRQTVSIEIRVHTIDTHAVHGSQQKQTHERYTVLGGNKPLRKCRQTNTQKTVMYKAEHCQYEKMKRRQRVG